MFNFVESKIKTLEIYRAPTNVMLGPNVGSYTNSLHSLMFLLPGVFG